MDSYHLTARGKRSGRTARLRRATLAGLLIVEGGCAAFPRSSLETPSTPPGISVTRPPAANSGVLTAYAETPPTLPGSLPPATPATTTAKPPVLTAYAATPPRLRDDAPPVADGKVDADPKPNPHPGRVEIKFDDHMVRTATTGSTLLNATDPKTLVGQPAAAVPTFPSNYPIDLTSALRLAEVENPVIAEARTRIGIALAERQAAMVLLLPTLNAGFNYHGHTGNLQRSSGRILSLSEQSLYYGAGARTLAAESVALASPGVSITSPLADAVFEPLAAQQRLTATEATATATANSVLLEVSTLYLALEGAELRLEAVRKTADEAGEVARLNVAYAKVGQRPPSDGARSLTELRLFQAQVQRAEQDVAVASTRLVQRLHMDPNVRVHTQGLAPTILTLVDPAATPVDLLEIAMRRRPEMYAATARIGVSETRYRQELVRPLLPTIFVNFSGGNFGGGSNLVPPLIGQYGGRTDFDVVAYWTLRNLGIGNLTIQKQRRAEIGVATAERSVVANQIRREVIAAFADSNANRQQLEVTRQGLASAELGYQADLIRARGAVGYPIEVLNSLKLLNAARLRAIDAIIGYDQAQFRLFVALGSPPPLGQGADQPVPPAPIADPPLPPPAQIVARSPNEAPPPIPAGATELR